MTDKLPHVCFVAPNAFPLLAGDLTIEVVGGAELQQVIIARGLVQRGYRVSMICLNFGQANRCEIDGIVVHRAFRPDEGVPIVRFVWPRLTSIWKCLKEVDADIYYQRAASVLTGVVAAYCKRRERKSIFAVAGEPMIRFRRDRWIYEYGLKRVDCVVVQSEAQQRFIEKVVGRNCFLIPSSYQPVAQAAPADGSHVLWVSTIRHWKRPELLLDVAESLPDVQFTMIGGVGVGERDLYETIRDRARTLRNVEFVGFVPHAEVGQYFDRSSLFINTSDNSEGFPNTFMQAWARGIPTVSFFDSGARMDGQPVGRLVDSTEEMIKVTAELLTDDSLRRRLGDDCKRYAERNHGPERVLDLYEELFRTMMDSTALR